MEKTSKTSIGRVWNVKILKFAVNIIIKYKFFFISFLKNKEFTYVEKKLLQEFKSFPAVEVLLLIIDFLMIICKIILSEKSDNLVDLIWNFYKNKLC